MHVIDRTIEYVCAVMLGHDVWRPNWGDRKWGNGENGDYLLRVLGRCESMLELMYVLGAVHYVDTHCEHDGGTWPTPIQTADRTYDGLFFVEPWSVFDNCGPSALALVPQYTAGRYRTDFALFTAGNNAGGPPWTLLLTVEVHGYAVHRNRRDEDRDRAREVESYTHVPTLQLYEETDSADGWMEKVVKYFHDAIKVPFDVEV